MTDRPALAAKIVDALIQADMNASYPDARVVFDENVVARVLAEHETHWTQDELDAVKWRAHERAAGFNVPCARAEAAEARCAQLEAERDEVRDLADHIECDRQEAVSALAVLQAEHERLRSALKLIIAEWRLTAHIWERQRLDKYPEPSPKTNPMPPRKGRADIHNWENWLKGCASTVEAVLAPSQGSVK